jgi:hypothetical protein
MMLLIFWRLMSSTVSTVVPLDPGSVNGKAREGTLARFAPVAQVKIRL